LADFLGGGVGGAPETGGFIGLLRFWAKNDGENDQEFAGN
jgi:hypothetical protein